METARISRFIRVVPDVTSSRYFARECAAGIFCEMAVASAVAAVAEEVNSERGMNFSD